MGRPAKALSAAMWTVGSNPTLSALVSPRRGGSGPQFRYVLRSKAPTSSEWRHVCIDAMPDHFRTTTRTTSIPLTVSDASASESKSMPMDS